MKSVLTGYKAALYLSWVVALILIFLPFHAFFTSWAANNFGHLDLFRIWKEIILAAILPAVFLLAWSRRDTRDFIKNSPIVKLFGIYVLLHLLLGAWALHNHKVNKSALIYSLIVNLRFVGFFIMTYIIASHSAFLKKQAARILIIPAFIVVVVGLLQKLAMPHSFLAYFYGWGTIPPYQTIDGNNKIQRVQSTLRGANPLGAYLVLGVGSFIGLAKRSYMKVIILLISFVVLFYSYSRSAWIGVLIMVYLLAWKLLAKRHHRLWLISSAIVAVLVLGGIFYLFRSEPAAQETLLHTSTVSKSPISSNQARLTSLKNGLHDVVHQPFGQGPGTAGPASFRNKPHQSRIAENYFLQIGQEVGLLGMAIFIAINVLVARQLWRVREEPLAMVLLASLAGISFINLISHAWADDTLSLLWWGMAAIALAPAIITDRAKAKNGKKIKTA